MGISVLYLLYWVSLLFNECEISDKDDSLSNLDSEKDLSNSPIVLSDIITSQKDDVIPLQNSVIIESDSEYVVETAVSSNSSDTFECETSETPVILDSESDKSSSKVNPFKDESFSHPSNGLWVEQNTELGIPELFDSNSGIIDKSVEDNRNGYTIQDCIDYVIKLNNILRKSSGQPLL